MATAKPPKSLSAKTIRGLKPRELAAETLALLDDFPSLRLSGLIGQNGETYGKYRQKDLLALFRDLQCPVPILVGESRGAVSKALQAIVTKGADNKPEYREDDTAIAQHIGNAALAEALLIRVQQRLGKAHAWVSHADEFAKCLDENNNIPPKLLSLLTRIGYRWYRKTILAEGDGLKPALHGAAMLMYSHPSEIDAERPAQEQMCYAIDAFTGLSRGGFLPSMLVLTELVADPDTLTPQERIDAVEAIRQGCIKTPDGSSGIKTRLDEILQQVDAPARNDAALLKGQPAASGLNR